MRIAPVALSIAILSGVQVTAYAAETASPRPSSTAKPANLALTQMQKNAIAAARTAFALAKTNAQDGFDRAIADAKAIRDQALSSSGNDQNAIRIAKKSYNDSYKIIIRAYKSDLNAAKLVLKNALATVRAPKRS